MNAESPLSITLIVIAVLALVGGIIVIVRNIEKKRTEALQAATQSMGLEFSRLPDPRLLPSLSAFPLFSQGHSKKARNIMTGMADEIEITLFDYRFTTGAGKSQHVHRQTVVLQQSSVLDLPAFSLKPQHVFHQIGKVFGYRDIDFDTHAIFSDKYFLRGADEVAIREVFTPDILEYYEARPGLSTEAARNRLLFFRASQKVKPEDLPGFLKDGFHIYTLFKRNR